MKKCSNNHICDCPSTLRELFQSYCYNGNAIDPDTIATWWINEFKNKLQSLKKKECASGCGCTPDDYALGHEGECVWTHDLSFNENIDEIISLIEE